MCNNNRFLMTKFSQGCSCSIAFWEPPSFIIIYLFIAPICHIVLISQQHAISFTSIGFNSIAPAAAHYHNTCVESNSAVVVVIWLKPGSLCGTECESVTKVRLRACFLWPNFVQVERVDCVVLWAAVERRISKMCG